jgi:hypothetical protein
MYKLYMSTSAECFFVGMLAVHFVFGVETATQYELLFGDARPYPQIINTGCKEYNVEYL